MELVVEGEIPSKAWWAAAAVVPRLRVMVWSMPPEAGGSLEFLRPVADRMVGLRICDWTCRDLSVLEHARRLRSLDAITSQPRVGVDLSRLPSLTSVGLPASDHVMSAATNPAVRSLHLDHASQARVDRIGSPVRELSLTSARKVRSLPPTLEALRSLSVHGASEFSFGSLAASRSLRAVDLQTIRRIGDIDRLPRSVRSLHIENCSEAPGLLSLVDRPELSVRLVGRRYPVSRAEVRERGLADVRRWALAPALVD